MSFPLAHWPDAHFPNAHWPHEAVPVPPAPPANTNIPGQLGDPRPRRREHWPKQGIGYEEEYRLLQLAEQAEAERSAREAQADSRVPLTEAVQSTALASKEALERAIESAIARTLEDRIINQAIADLLQEDEDAMHLILSVL